MPGFEEYRARALRNNSDWRNQYVEYSDLKANIVSFLNRRSYFSNIISAGSEITEEDLNNARILQPQKLNTSRTQPDKKIRNSDNEQSEYHEFVEAEDQRKQGEVLR